MAKCKCQSCGGEMDLKDDQNILFCPYCGSKEILRNVINIENYNVSSNVLDADTMFENWLITHEDRLRKDFAYYYATDPRNEFILVSNVAYWPLLSTWDSLEEYERLKQRIDTYEKMADKFLVGERFGKYRNTYSADIMIKKREIEKYEENLRQKEIEEEHKRIEAVMKEEEQKKFNKGCSTFIWIILIIILALIINKFC